MKPTEILRWATILVCGGFGVYSLGILAASFRSFTEGEWVGGMFMLCFNAVFAGVPLAMAWFAFRGDCRRVTRIVAVVVAVLVFGALISIPRRSGFPEYLSRLPAKPWLILIELAVSLLCFFGAIFVARWSYRLCLRLADRYLLPSSAEGSALHVDGREG